MPGFETIVRPVVFPNIRPAPTRSLPPADDPEQGLCVIRGSGGGIISTNYSASISGSTHNPKETERRVDTARVYQKDDDGTINRENFIDIEVANRITMEEKFRKLKKLPAKKVLAIGMLSELAAANRKRSILTRQSKKRTISRSRKRTR